MVQKTGETRALRHSVYFITYSRETVLPGMVMLKFNEALGNQAGSNIDSIQCGDHSFRFL